MRSQWIWSDLGQPAYWSSGLCSCVAGKFVWYVLLCNLLALRWCLVSVYVWRHLMSSCRLMFPGVSSQDLDLSLLLLVFSLIFTVVSRLFLLYSTVEKTSKTKSFSTVRDTQRSSHSYMEKRRGRRELEVTQMRWGGIKRGESKLANNHFLMCAPQSGQLRDVHGVIQRREEGGRRQRWRVETEVT